MNEYLLSPAEFDATARKIEAINARAAKRGFTGSFQLAGVSEIIQDTSPSGLPVARMMYRCTLDGEAPSYGGWRFLAALEGLPAADGGTVAWIVRCAPGVSDEGVDRGTLHVGFCSHCGVARANRRKLYLVQHVDTGEYRQVGSTCAKDFLGWSGNPVWIDEEKVRSEVEDAVGSRAEISWTPRTVLAAAIAVTAAHGWVPASWDGVSTSERVKILLGGARTKRDAELIEAVAEHFPAAEAQVDVDLPEALALTAPARDGYVANLHSALAADAVTMRTFALVCSTISFLGRERQQGAERAKSASFTPEWLGEIDEKITFTGEVTTCLSVDGFAYDTTQLLVIVTTDTALVKFTTMARWADELKRGDQVTLTATVKKHNLYEGRKQTLVNRPKPV